MISHTSISFEKGQTKFLPYNLKNGEETSDLFYSKLKSFSSEVFSFGLKKFKTYFLYFKDQPIHSKQEIFIVDLLIAGVLWNEYGNRSGIRFLNSKSKILNNLFLLRKKMSSLKRPIDTLRTRLSQKWLLEEIDVDKIPAADDLMKLSQWLKATGEYNEESKKIVELVRVVKSMPPAERDRFIAEVMSYALWFKFSAKAVLGSFTSNVRNFMRSHYLRYSGREDFFFCGKKEVEYHLNMVGASLLNQLLKEQFNKTDNTILLLPTCMAKNDRCKAVFNAGTLQCVHCTLGCKVSEVASEVEKSGIETLMIKHSSDFSKWLKPWANQTKTGVIGTACVLNLLQGGYEMQRLNIPSQCVYLDHCSCSKHWGFEGLPTDLNISQVPGFKPLKKCL
jgi:uncharacterized protein